MYQTSGRPVAVLLVHFGLGRNRLAWRESGCTRYFGSRTAVRFEIALC